ncbi:hypothetical protein CON15_19675 [Bacillus cereus]|uniref:DUF3221 domain-containing protein n=1 Tax=Bacillus thuringiensis TaxID=1428 RepID=A0AB36VG78_BACTU|nr:MULTISPECIES: hypothetical protein [Bacillus cereus group]MEB9467850.1 hypothetical protein [Bacillus cereus]MRA82455.1 hypothetical protein [Bacillus thuringiensis]OUA16731.1 hypothetical protein BK776_30790 [Bacillus thuringiensis serovar aizawai]PDZ55762.1 hypothetical protein CON15_19675 [Bacillus cereus]PFC28535.1 hypothetical protein CN299_19895 [Bacillus thuringiensis]
MKKLLALLMACMLLGGCNAPDYAGEVKGAKIVEVKRDSHRVVVEKNGNVMEFYTHRALIRGLREGNTISFKYNGSLYFSEVQVDGLTTQVKE